MLDLFITGADEYSDKIFVTAGLAATMQSLGYSCGVYKPVDICAVENNEYIQSPDLLFVKFVDPYIKTYFSYLFKSNSAPILAAAAEKTEIKKNNILADFQKIQDINECLIVDGVCGLASPLGKNFLEDDMIKMLDLPLLLVVSAKTANINNILLTINHATETGINVRGVILNSYPKINEDVNLKLIPKLVEEYTNTKVLGILPEFDKNLNPNDLITEILNGVDVEGVFNLRIAKLQM